ncbi:MAG: hypothetical protein HY466_02905 [Deltaproteobacteria bacterium]|nr:hypothetical protein [Deltaproteobacteria bacterium]
MSPKIRSVLFVWSLASAGLIFSACHCHHHQGPHRHNHHKDLPSLGVSNSVEKYCLSRGYEPGTLDFKNCVHKRQEHLRQKKKIYQHEQMQREEPKSHPKKKQTGETVKKPLPPPKKKAPPPDLKQQYPKKRQTKSSELEE